MEFENNGRPTEEISERYFIQMSLLDRIRFLSEPTIDLNLRRVILKEQFLLSSRAIKELGVEHGFGRRELEILRDDQVIQQTYGELLRLSETFATVQERKIVQVAFSSLEVLLKVGFLDYYQRHWEKKLGASFT